MAVEVEKTLADQLREERLTTKDDLLGWIDREVQRVNDQSKSDKKHSSAFYYAYVKLLKRFRRKLEETALFNRLEDYWYYSISVSSSGAELALNYTPNCELNDKGNVVAIGGQVLPFIRVPARFLTVEEYASEYGVGAGTVRQWIRRGKLRTAKKAGKEWMIPEMTDLPPRGYQSAAYFYNGHLDNCPDDYNFLEGYTAVIINQDHDDPAKFNVIVATASEKQPKIMTLDTKAREKLELFLIAHPDVRYVEGPTDGLNVARSSKALTKN